VNIQQQMGQDADSVTGSGMGADKVTNPRLIDRVREAIRSRHYSRRREKTCCCRMQLSICFLAL